MDEDEKAARGCAIGIAWMVLTAGVAVVVGVAWHPAMGAALWLTANGLLLMLALANAGE